MYEPATETEKFAHIDLSIEDHTRIIEAVMENSFHLLRGLDLRKYVKDGQKPSGEEVLQAMLNVDTVDDYRKARIRDVLDVQSILEGVRRDESVSREMDDRTDEISRAVASEETITEKIERVKDLRRSGDLQRGSSDDEVLGRDEANEMIDRTAELTIEMLRDGQKSIYWPGHEFYSTVQGEGSTTPTEKRRIVSDTANADTKGLAAGAAGGCAAGSVAGGVGCAPGAVTGGVGGAVTLSAGEVIGAAIDWLFD